MTHRCAPRARALRHSNAERLPLSRFRLFFCLTFFGRICSITLHDPSLIYGDRSSPSFATRPRPRHSPLGAASPPTVPATAGARLVVTTAHSRPSASTCTLTTGAPVPSGPQRSLTQPLTSATHRHQPRSPVLPVQTLQPGRLRHTPVFKA